MIIDMLFLIEIETIIKIGMDILSHNINVHDLSMIIML